MNKKKIIIVLAAIIIAAATGIGAFLVLSRDREQYVSAEEWIKLLGEHTGRDSLSLPEGYYRKDKADTRLISITAFETIDEHKLKRIVTDKDTLSEEDLYKLAESYSLIKDKKSKYTKEDCEAILDSYNEIYFDEIWLDDYCEVE